MQLLLSMYRFSDTSGGPIRMNTDIHEFFDDQSWCGEPVPDPHNWDQQPNCSWQVEGSPQWGDVGWTLGSWYTDGNLWCYVPGIPQFSWEIISWLGFCKWLRTMYKLYKYKVSNLAVHANWVQRAWLIHDYSCSFCLEVLSCHKKFHGVHGGQTLHELAKVSSQLNFLHSLGDVW